MKLIRTKKSTITITFSDEKEMDKIDEAFRLCPDLTHAEIYMNGVEQILDNSNNV